MLSPMPLDVMNKSYSESSFYGMPMRWVMVMLMWGGITISYTVRVCMSVAIEGIQKEMKISDSGKGYMLSAFYWGYATGQIPSVLLGAKRPKSLFGMSILIPSLLSLIFPSCIRYNFGLGLFVRMLMGLFASSAFPNVFIFFSKWFPRDEKTLMIATTVSGMYVGEILGFCISGVVCVNDYYFPPLTGDINIGRWPGVFYLFGIFGLLYVPIWWQYAYDSPEGCPYVSFEEKQILLEQTMGYSQSTVFQDDDNVNETVSILRDGQLRNRVISTPGSDKTEIEDIKDSSESLDEVNSIRHIPWKAFFTNPVSLTCIVCAWNFGWIGFMMLSEMPNYLIDELEFKLEMAGVLSVVPYVFMLIAVIFFAWAVEYLQFQLLWSVKYVRHFAMFCAFGGASGFLLLATYTKDSMTALLFVSLSQACLGAYQSGLACAFLEISPNFSAIMNTVANTFAALGGVASPIFVGMMIEEFDDDGWRLIFWFTFVQSILALYLWFLYFTGDVVPDLNEAVQYFALKTKEQKMSKP
jgi:MFS family permease